MSTGINSACPLFLHRADSQRASNIPDAGMFRKMVRACTCHPVLRGILDSLLHYLTQDLAERAVQDRNLKKPRSDGSEHRTENSNKLQNSYGGTTSRELLPRHLTTFQLLQSKFMRSSSKGPVTHQREVGTLSSSRGATSNLKNSKGEDPEPKSQTRRGQGHKRGGSVKDIVAKFAVADHKEKGEITPRNQPLKPRLTGRGTVLSSLMERFETVATVRKGSAGAQVRLPSDVKQMVARRERLQRRGEDGTVHKQNQPREMRIQADLEGHRSSSGQEQGPGPSARQIKSNPGKNHLKHLHQKPEDQCLIKTRKHPTCSKADKNSVQHGEIQSRSEEANITAHLKYGDLMVLNFKSVTETFLPEPYKLVPQVEALMKCHVGTIIASSPVWSTCVAHSPELHPAEPPETTVQPPGVATEYGSCLKPQSEENRGAEGDILHLSESRTGQRSGPTYIIPRVHRFTFPQDIKDHARSSQLPAADSENNFLNVAQPAYWDSSDTGPVARPPSNTEKPVVQITIKDTQTEYKHHGKEGEAKELTPVVTEDTNTQLSEETKAKAAPEGTIPAVSSSEGLREADNQKLRPKYKTINYGDPSVKETYKPKIIRFTDTFTF